MGGLYRRGEGNLYFANPRDRAALLGTIGEKNNGEDGVQKVFEEKEKTGLVSSYSGGRNLKKGQGKGKERWVEKVRGRWRATRTKKIFYGVFPRGITTKIKDSLKGLSYFRKEMGESPLVHRGPKVIDPP